MIRSGCSSMALSNASAPSESVCTVAKWASACRNNSSTMGLSSTSRTLMLLGMMLLFPGFHLPGGMLPLVLAALAAGLPFQHDLANGDALVQGLAHVVNGERGDAGGDQRLHFHPRGRCS